MKVLQDQYEFPLTLRVPKTAFVIVAPEPATVTQHTAELHFGIPTRAYKQMTRDGLFPTKRIGRLIFASYGDVKRVLLEGAVAQERVKKAVESAQVRPDEAPMSVEAAHTYLASARSPTEERARGKEIELLGHEIGHKYGATLDDDSPDPLHSACLYSHGSDLLAASMGLRRTSKAARRQPVPSTAGDGGYYRQCCWCELPAYATKQTWMGDYWCGGPVCNRCARTRAPNERIVEIDSQTILLPASDLTVPTTWDAPRR